LIACFCPQSNGSEESLDAAAGIYSKVGGAAAKLVECVVKRFARYSGGGGVAEFSEADLACNERAKGTGCAELKFGSEETGKWARFAGDSGAGYTGG